MYFGGIDNMIQEHYNLGVDNKNICSNNRERNKV